MDCQSKWDIENVSHLNTRQTDVNSSLVGKFWATLAATLRLYVLGTLTFRKILSSNTKA